MSTMLIHSGCKEEQVKTHFPVSLSSSLLSEQKRISKAGPLPNNKSVFSMVDREIEVKK